MTFSTIRMSWYSRLISLCVIVAFVATMVIAPRASYAQSGIMGLPMPGTMVDVSPAYVPLMITGLSVHPENPLLMDFIVSTGNSGMDVTQVKSNSDRLIKYFLACLTIPENDQWVNLSPYEKERIVPEDLGKTVLGQDMMAQDYLLKQLTASLIYPEKNLGKDFWDKIYAKANEMYGTSQIPVNTFNKVWILPDTAKVYEHKDTVFVVKSHLKVMLDEDYLALLKHNSLPTVGRVREGGDIDREQVNNLGSQIVRQIIVPAIEQEVNTGKNFGNLRQIYNSMILAVWFKKNLKQALLNQVYTDKAKVNGVNVDDPAIKEKIYRQYIQAYRKGVFNYIKEDVDQNTQEVVPRKYFSGGLTAVNAAMLSEATVDEAMKAFNGMPANNEDFIVKGLTGLTQGTSGQIDKASISQQQPENLRVASTVTNEDFQELVRLRQAGLAGIHKNVDPRPVIPATETAVINWQAAPAAEKDKLTGKEDNMFSQGEIAALDMVGGEATRFGGPKTFVKVSDDLGEFMRIKAANQWYIDNHFGRPVPRYAMTSEKRLPEFLEGLQQRDYYGLGDNIKPFVQGTVDTFILTDEEIEASFKDQNEIAQYKIYAANQRSQNPDGIYRFKGEERKVPAGHLDAIASFVISGQMTDALKRGVKFISVENIDNLQAILKPDGMIAKFDEMGVDFGFILAEKNLTFKITDTTGKVLVDKLIVRFRDNVISFDGINEFSGQAEKDGLRFVINGPAKTVDVFDANGQKIETNNEIKAETGGTLVQPVDEDDNPVGEPIMKEGFELPKGFDHVNAPFFNTNSIVVRLDGLLRILGVSKEDLNKMNWDERSSLVREKLVKSIKPNFELKYHEVDGEYPTLGIVQKNGKTKIPVAQLTRIMLQSAHLPGAKVGYIFAPRAEVFAPVKEPEDLKVAAENNAQSLKAYTDYSRFTSGKGSQSSSATTANAAMAVKNEESRAQEAISARNPEEANLPNLRQAPSDKAALAEKGGIDLNARHLNLESSGEKMNITFDPAMIAQFKRGDFSGVRIQILDVVPINLMPLLGLKEDEEPGQLARV